MILREKETGMVIEQVEIALTFNGHSRVRNGLSVTGIVREPGASRFVVGQPIAWPYVPKDWEEVGE